MTVTAIDKDPTGRTLTITAAFDAPVARVWQVWSDPRQLERWWGPPSYPATFVAHELAPNGRAAYYMTGPDGTRYHGWWHVRTVDAPHGFTFDDGFADDEGRPDDAMPVTLVAVRIEAQGARTIVTITSTFASVEDMERLLAMGMDEGMAAALGQVDELLRH